MKAIFILVLSLVCNFSFAQFVDTAYIYTYGGPSHDYAKQIISTTDSGYIIIGTTSSFGAGQTDVYLIKTDRNCNKQWSNVYGTPAIEWGYSVRETSDKGFVLAGYTNQDSAGNYEVYLLKVDSLGALKWSKTIGGNNWNFGYGLELANDGGFIICGKTYGPSNGGTDVYIIKADSMGNVVWTKNYGGINDESANAIIKDRESNYIIVGETYSYGAGDDDYYVLKINENGDTLWTKTFGTPQFDAAYGVDTTLDGNYLVIGTSEGFPGPDKNIYFLKIDTNGNVIWTQVQGGSGDEEGRVIKQLPNGNIVSGGMTLSYGAGGKGFYILLNDNSGNYINGATFGGPADDEGYSLAVGKDNHLVFAGITESYGCGDEDVYLIRIDTLNIVANYTLTIHSLCDSTVPVKEISSVEESTPLIYPNPFSDWTQINFGSSVNINNSCNFTVYDMLGKKVHEVKNVKTNILKFQRTDNLRAGIYLFVLYDDSVPVSEGKFVIY